MVQVMYMTFQYLTVSCILHGTGHVYDISIPDSFMYITCYRSCIWRFNTWQFHVYYLLQVMYMTFQ